MGDLTSDAVPMGTTPPSNILNPQPNGQQTRPGRQVYNIVNASGVHIGPVFNNPTVSRPTEPRLDPNNMPLKRDVDELLKCHREIGDNDIFIVGEHLGGCWKSLGRAMGFSNGQLENVEADNTRNADRTVELLTKWQDRESERATVTKLSQLIIDVKAYHVLKFLKP